MALRTIVLKSFYQDSVALMRVAQGLRAVPGVREAALLMGTPSNHGVLAQAGLASKESEGAGADDLIMAVEAESEAEAEAALAAGRELITHRRLALEEVSGVLPRTLETAISQLPGANLAAISVPGEHVRLEAMRALRRGLHLFLFSDNVPLEAEVELKREALARGLLCMGPDCGTAYLNGTGLGFYNVVLTGRVGLVAASGTGLQAVACGLAALGEGISQGIGVGGRDLSGRVGGVMTLFALDALARDPATEAVVLISKPPAAEVLPALEAGLSKLGKPAVVCCLGALPRSGGQATGRNPVRWVETLEDAALAAAAALRGEDWSPRRFGDGEAVRARLGQVRGEGDPAGGRLVGLYTGGTLAHEALLILRPLLGEIASNLGEGGAAGRRRVLDLGEDEYTRGRPHPMIDPDARADLVRTLGEGEEGDEEGTVLLLDLVLGRGSHPDPAGPLAEAVAKAREKAGKRGRPFAAVASVVGTRDDPQDLAAQTAALEKAGAVVLPSNAQAARFAAILIEPALAGSLLGDSP